VTNDRPGDGGLHQRWVTNAITRLISANLIEVFKQRDGLAA
jgi:hypothetical protein